MATFLFSGQNPDQQSVTDRIEAETLSSAKYKLELRGYSNIVFHTDEMSTNIDRSLFDDDAKRPTPQMVLTPDQERDARRAGGVLGEIWTAWKLNAVLWMPLAVWDAVALFRKGPLRHSDWVAFGLSALFLLYFIWMVLPGIAYQKLLESGVWYRWSEVRTWVRFIRLMKRFTFIPIPDFELDFRLAYATAAQGKLEEALSMVKHHENGKCGKFQYYGRLGGLYEAAGEFSKMTECRKLAAEHGSGLNTERIDIAVGLLRRERKPVEARAILQEIGEVQGSEIVAMFLQYAYGLLAIEEQDWVKAETDLRRTLELAAPSSSNLLVKGMLNEVKAYRGIALANLGRVEEARELFREAEALLKARGDKVLLGRCQAALIRQNDGANILSH
jgi:tetratricopeptide (TPR) repeat protein